MKSIRFFLTLTLTISLIGAFGLHSIETKHQHFGSAHTHSHSDQSHQQQTSWNIDEYVHGIEQKFILVLLLTLIVFGASILVLQWPTQFFPLTVLVVGVQLRLSQYQTTAVPDFLKKMLSSGILNPKVH